MTASGVASMPIIKVRDKLTSLPETLASAPSALVVTRRGEPVLAILSWELYESIVKTLEILGDGEQLAALRQGIKEADKGQAIDWAQAKRGL